MLRFPVDVRKSARLSFCLGANHRISVQMSDITMRVDFVPETGSREGQTKPEPVALWETTPGANPECFKEWLYVDIELNPPARGKGEIRFLATGPLAGNPMVDIMWGRPTVYYPAERHHHNVLLIGIDTLRRDALDVYGGRPEVSPNLRRLSESATIFDRAWSQAPYTGPSFASMVTGRLNSDLCPTFSPVQLPDQCRTIAETLHQNGYGTFMICGNPYLGDEVSGFNQGMEESWYQFRASPTDSVTQAKEFIGRAADRDWFLFMHIIDPHTPYDPPEEFISAVCDPDYHGKYPTEFTESLPWQLLTRLPPQHEIDRVRSLYEAEVADGDAAIGELFAFLEQKSLLDDTLVILAADHGEEFFDHGQYEHGQSFYEEMVHLPLMVWGSEFPRGKRIETPVANVDIVPTILSHLGLEVSGALPGVPLQNAVKGPPDENRIIFGEGNLRRSSHAKYALEWPYKCILNFYTGRTKLYNLEDDPDERVDLSVPYPDVAQRLAAETVRVMRPLQTIYILTIMGNSERGPKRFSGTARVPGGIIKVRDSGLLPDDSFSVDGETISFDFSAETAAIAPIKGLIIIPEPEADTIELQVQVDGHASPDRFFPYASSTPEPSGRATVNIRDLPWPNAIPDQARELPIACYLLGIPAFPREEGQEEIRDTELSPETVEQLRALGYID